jgi:hypothetical protein
VLGRLTLLRRTLPAAPGVVRPFRRGSTT